MTGPAIFSAALAFPDIDPVIVQFGPVAIRWYSLAYIAGILLGWFYARRLITTDRLWGGGGPKVSVADLDDFLFWAVIGVVAGGRLGFVLFYDAARYLDDPLQILAVWQGGMSFHGGLLGVTVAMVLFARSRAIPVLQLTDIVSAVAPFGIFFGRIANFINAELWGRTTNVAWGVVFPNGGDLPRHPSQLYEAALEGLALFVLLRLATHQFGALKRPGLVTGLFIAGYGAARTFVEFFREPDAQIGYLAGGWLTMGMVLSVPMIVFGLILASASRKPSSA